ncbi:MAG: C40 family peptidase [Clostridiales bacterium]|jgi:hypothetical protein|nr:C40 family peptidase [Clostridiales bacterium]
MKAVVINDLAPLYTKPDKDSELADEALFGMVTTVLDTEKSKDFLLVETHYRYQGLSPSSCYLLDQDAISTWESLKKWTVQVNYLDVRKEPHVIAPTLASLTRGGLLGQIEGESDHDGWTLIQLPCGRRGYVKTPCIREQITSWDKQNESALRKALTDTAKLYIGTQYRWGGKSPLGIDCSGLTSVSYLQNGILIYRDASIKEGFEMRPIPLDQAKEGDLYFFKGHVAMCLGGRDFIHSTAYKLSPGVTFNSLDPDSPAYRPDLVEDFKTAGTIF